MNQILLNYDENIWLTQKMLSVLYDVELNTINYHIKKIYNDNELSEDSTIRKFRIVQNEGKRNVARDVINYIVMKISIQNCNIGKNDTILEKKL